MSDLLNITTSPAQAVPNADGADQGREKREHPRYGCEGYAEVFLPQGGLLFRGRILNLSLTGCYVETALLNLERGTQVEVYFVTQPAAVSGIGKHRGAATEARRGDCVCELKSAQGAADRDAGE